MSGQSILKNVSRGSFFLATEQFSGLLSGVVYSVVVLRWLGPEGYGLLSLGLAVIGLTSIATGNFEVFLERYAAEYETRGLISRLRRAHFLAMGFKIGLGLVAALAIYGLATWIGVRYEEPRLTNLIIILSGMLALEGFTVTGRAVLYGLQRFGWLAIAAVIYHILKIAIVVLLWVQGAGIMALAASLVALSAIQGLLLTSLAVFFVRAGREAVDEAVSPPIQAIASPESSQALGGTVEIAEPSLVSSMFRYCLPLFGARAAYLAGQNMSRVVLGAFLNLQQLGYFSFAFTVVERFVGFVYALPSSLLPSLTQLWARGDRLRFTRLLDKAFRLVATAAATLSFGLFVFAEEITLIVGGHEYLPAVPVLRVMALIPWVRTSHQPLTMGFYALKHTSWVLVLALIKLAAELGAYFLLIPLWGVQGAASAHVLGAGLAIAGALFLLGRSFQPGTHRWAVMGKTTGLFFLAAAATLALTSFLHNTTSLILIKIFILTPTYLLAVFLCDLVTEDDLKRAASIDIRPGWMRFSRDAVVRAGLRLSRAVGPHRPASLGTAEGN